MSKIKITLNGEEKVLENQETIADLIQLYELDIKKVAIEKDLQVISPDKYRLTQINDGCNIEIIHYIGGG